MNFINCNSRTRYDRVVHNPYVIMEEKYLRELKESIESGLIPNTELDLFIMDGYGALVGPCPLRCQSLKQLFKYTPDLSMREKLISILDGTKPEKTYSHYEEYYNEGAQLVIGPGCKVNGMEYEKAIYCKNYQEMIEKNKIKNEQLGFKK